MVYEGSFELCEQDVFANFSEIRGAFYVTKTKSHDIHRKDISDEDWSEFGAAIENDGKSMLYKNKAMVPLNLKESQDTWDKFPERVMRSRYR